MKLKNILVGFIVGTIGGATLAVLNAPKSGKDLQSSLTESSGTIKSASNQIKEEVSNIKNSVLRAKHEASNIGDLVDEVKTLVSNFQKDIEPNVDHLKTGVDDINNRVSKIEKKLSE